MDLLRQFELILESDKLIDEVGFLHPTQFTSLGETSSPDSSTKVSESIHLQYDTTALWIRDHKLAISTDVLSELYVAAREAFLALSKDYKTSVKNGDAFIGDTNHMKLLEYEILKHTKALLILCCSFNGAWNCRKLVLSTKHELSLFLDDLQLSSLILSFSPKCESAWNHRRWVIKKVVELPELHEIVREESELVKKLAEKSKMNYRAWSHRCWLISYMTKAQVLDDLDKSKKWAELHIADSSCFHHRRQLMFRLLEEYHSDPEESCFKCNTCFTLKEELDWDEILIKRYIGREALWIHRRLLSLCWIKHLKNNMEVVKTDLEHHRHTSSSLDIFLDKELDLVQSCLNTSHDEFDDNRIQAQHAASYVLWIKEFFELQTIERISKWIEDRKSILLKIKTENNLRWVQLPSI